LPERHLAMTDLRLTAQKDLEAECKCHIARNKLLESRIKRLKASNDKLTASCLKYYDALEDIGKELFAESNAQVLDYHGENEYRQKVALKALGRRYRT